MPRLPLNLYLLTTRPNTWSFHVTHVVVAAATEAKARRLAARATRTRVYLVSEARLIGQAFMRQPEGLLDAPPASGVTRSPRTRVKGATHG